MRGQLLFEVCAHRGQIESGNCHHVSCERRGHGTTHADHDRLRDIRIRRQDGFDLAQFDAQTSQLHLVIATPGILELQLAVLGAAPSHHISGAVEAVAATAEGIGHIARSSQACSIEIAAGQRDTTDVELAGNIHGNGLQRVVEDHQSHTPDGSADAHRVADAASAVGDGDRRLGRAVGIEEGNLVGPPIDESLRQRLTPRCQELQTRDGCGIDRRGNGRRHERMRYPGLAHELFEQFPADRALGPICERRSPGGGDQPLEDRRVEARRRIAHHHRPCFRPVAAQVCCVVVDTSVGDGNTFGPTGRPGRVDHVGEGVEVTWTHQLVRPQRRRGGLSGTPPNGDDV
ncbi:Uncharacterised protein [Mycobacteroides abscessus subsp. abscessus]|nr:Uncharacterised protein [Mycobacteroides abscessus subsp. abscessus]